MKKGIFLPSFDQWISGKVQIKYKIIIVEYSVKIWA